MKIIVFTGTSISIEDAQKILNADYRPPVKRCDVKIAKEEGASIIGIIDGIFYDRAAVAHKEIISAMKSGITVVGGSSMGALRASELDVYGMIGVGKIYEWYKNGFIESDDEVAVTFDPETLEPLSIPLVNVRVTLDKAEESGIITKEQNNALIEITKKIFYPDRNYASILESGVKENIISKETKETLFDFIKSYGVDLKRDDAILVLEKIKEML
ncbi:MAG: TfuA-related McrA-glycine thioamidation protein [Methanosarcinales archaeon]